MRNTRFCTITARAGLFPIILLSVILFTSGQARLCAADTNLPPVPAHADETNSQEILRVYLQLQEQLHSAQLAIEQSRKESREATVQSAEALSERLHAIEQALATQRARELEAMQSSNRVMLIVAGSFACVGFLVMIVGAYFQWRTAQSLTSLSGMSPIARGLAPSPTFPALGPGEGQVLSLGAAEQSNMRLLGALEQLEKRINELEHTSRIPLKEGTPAGDRPKSEAGNYGADHQPLQSNGGSGAASGETGEAEQVEMLLGKGISMLNLDQVEAAIDSFDKVLSLDPHNAEALVRKGIALERLQMLNEAVHCYDRAISIDGSLTIAYLHKGGLYNRMERYDEALACYEQALRTQERRNG